MLFAAALCYLAQPVCPMFVYTLQYRATPSMPCLLLVLQVMDTRKVKYMVVNDSAAEWSESAPYFLFSPTGTKQELQEALLAKLEHQGRAALFLQDSDGDFADWDEPIALPTSGTARVKVVLSTGVLFNIR